MPDHSNRRRCAAALLAGLGLVGVLAACDGGGSSKSAGTSTSTRHRKPHASTTTSSSTAPAAATSTTTTTLAGAQPDTAVTDPNAPTTTTSPLGASPCGAQEPRLAAVATGGDLQGVSADQYTVANCRLSSSHLTWGAVTMVPKPGTSVSTLTVVFERVGSIWDVHSYAAGPTGCDAPAPAPNELGLGC